MKSRKYNNLLVIKWKVDSYLEIFHGSLESGLALNLNP